MPRQHARAGQLRQQPGKRVMRQREGVALPRCRHLGHPIDARHFLDRGIGRGAARATRGRGVGNGDDAHAGAADLVDALDFGAGRHQIGAGDEIIGRAEIDFLGALGVLRHEGEVAGGTGNGISDLARIVIDLQHERQFQGFGEGTQQIERDAPHLALAVLDGKKHGSRRRYHHAAAHFSGRCELFEIVGIYHAARI